MIADSDVYIGREFRDRRRRILAASKWRNPYKLRDHGDVHECIAKFDSNLLALMAELLELSGKRLLCHCRRGAPSHADAIIGAFAEFVMNAPTHDATLQVGVYRDEVESAGEALKVDAFFEAHACSTSPSR